MPSSGPKLREVFGERQAEHGTVLVVVDQPASIGALSPPALARDTGCPVACPRADDAADRRSLFPARP
ncbi:hypothetical protein [Streptomyces sp. 3211]|uniref:hypothetical protein n=1 Tax=Streptomyces sp. 3211 TaxID=1964449 RepID=UPI00300186E3